MRSFTDTTGRQWAIDLNIGAIKRVKSLVGVDLLEIQDGQLLVDLANDPMKMADILYAVVYPQATAKDVSDEAFGSALGGDAMRLGIDAFVEELIDFFQKLRPAVGQVLNKLWSKLETYNQRAQQEAVRRVEDPRIDQAIEKAMSEVLTKADEQLNALLGASSTP